MGWTLSNFWMKLNAQKLEGWGYWSKLNDPNFSRFWLIHPCDRQTDRQTDGMAIEYARLEYAVARKNQTDNGKACKYKIYRPVTVATVSLQLFLRSFCRITNVFHESQIDVVNCCIQLRWGLFECRLSGDSSATIWTRSALYTYTHVHTRRECRHYICDLLRNVKHFCTWIWICISYNSSWSFSCFKAYPFQQFHENSSVKKPVQTARKTARCCSQSKKGIRKHLILYLVASAESH